jgi:hypothetical protein
VQLLDRDLPTQELVVCPPHHTHATLAEPSHEPVTPRDESVRHGGNLPSNRPVTWSLPELSAYSVCDKEDARALVDGSVMWDKVPVGTAARHGGDWLVELLAVSTIVGLWL